MILFTILSRVTYNMSMATVETTQPARETMGPVIETKAAVEGKQEVAVIAKENQIIQSILVTVGQAVEKDQVLYTLDLKELDKQIKEKSQELELNKAQLANAQNALQSTIDSQQLQISQAMQNAACNDHRTRGVVKSKTGDDTTDATYQNWYKAVYMPATEPETKAAASTSNSGK